MKRIFTAVLALAFIAGAVGLGVHLLNKKVLAGNYQIHVWIWDIDEQEWHVGDGVVVSFAFDGGAPTNKTTDGSGDAYMSGNPVIDWEADAPIGAWEFWENATRESTIQPPVEAWASVGLITLFLEPVNNR